MSSCFSTFDFTDSIVGLTYNGNRHYKSATGGIISIIMLFGIIIIIVLNAIPYITKKHPQVWIDDIRYSTPPILDISSNFYFAIMTQEVNKTSFNHKYQIDAIYHSDHQSIKQRLQQFPCNQIGSDLENLFKQMRLTNGLCFNMANTAIGGSGIDDIFQYVQIEIKMCKYIPKNDKNNDICCSPDELITNEEVIGQAAQLYFIDTVFQIKNHTMPMKHYLKYINVNFSYYNNNEVNAYFEYDEMHIENNFYTLSKPAIYSHYIIDHYQFVQSYRNSKEPITIKFNLLSSHQKRIVNVSYTKFFDMIVTISSLSYLVIFVFKIIGQNLNHSLYQNELIHSLFRINRIKKKTIRPINHSPRKQPIQQNIQQALSLDQNSFDLCNSPILVGRVQKNQNKTQIQYEPKSKPDTSVINNQGNIKPNVSFKKHMTLNQYKLNVQREEFQFTLPTLILIGLSKLIPCLCCKEVQKNKMSFKMLNNLISIYQEVKNVYRKLQEIDLMKYLLFSEEQLASYQLIPQPECLLNTNLIPIPLDSNDFLAKLVQKSYHFMKAPNDANKMNENKHNKEIKENIINNNGMDVSFNDRIKRLILNDCYLVEE